MYAIEVGMVILCHRSWYIFMSDGCFMNHESWTLSWKLDVAFRRRFV